MMVIVLTGPRCSGKSTQASPVATAIRAKGVRADYWYIANPKPNGPMDLWSAVLRRAEMRSRLVHRRRDVPLIVCDTWVYDDLAYVKAKPESAAREGALAVLHHELSIYPPPQLVVVYDGADPALNGRIRRESGDVPDDEDQKIREWFRAYVARPASQQHAERVVQVRADRSVTSITLDTLRAIEQHFPYIAASTAQEEAK